MPLFMDRHDVPGATAADAAAAHVKDLEVAKRHGVEFLSYWFDANAGGVFCFAKAPSPENLEAVHAESHGLVPNEIIGVSEDNVLRFLGRIHDPADASEVESPFRTILFTDLEGSTSLLNEVGESVFMVLLTEHDLIIRRALVASRGREVKHTGDGVMASFDAATDALRCAMAIQDGLGARISEGADHQLRVRIGIAAGQPVEHNEDLFGAAVNLASRICDAAQAGHILVSDLVQELGVEGGFSFGEPEALLLKGFSDPTLLYELQRGEI